jgi:hypothetical protein
VLFGLGANDDSVIEQRRVSVLNGGISISLKYVTAPFELPFESSVSKHAGDNCGVFIH